MDIDSTAARRAGLGNPTRRAPCRALVRAGDNGLTMGQAQERLCIPASTFSHHCRALVQVGLIRQERAGTSPICRTNCAAMRGPIADPAAECCADAAPAPAPGSAPESAAAAQS